MRHIGTLAQESDAQKLTDYLITRGIPSEVQPASQGWSVWVREEDHRDRAKQVLEEFLRQPSDPRYEVAIEAARNIRREAEKENQRRAQNFIELRKRWEPVQGARPLTMVLIGLSIVATVATSVEKESHALRNVLDITAISPEGIYRLGLPEIRKGEIWRLITPVFVHASFFQSMGIFHLLFNMFWLRDLGGMIEARRGTFKLLLLFLASAVPSNGVQYYMEGPNFGGMSGVVYALFGYVWMKSRYDSGSGLFLHPNTVTFMMAWFLLCWTGLMGPIANSAHAAGLALGVAAGITPYLWKKLRSR